MSDDYIAELAEYLYGVVRGFKLMFTVFPGVVHWNDMPESGRREWKELVRYRLLRPFADANTRATCMEAMGWHNKRHINTAYELLASVCRVIQLGIASPTADCCNKHAALSITTMFNCGLPKGHPGVCVPAGADPIPEAPPAYQPGDDE
ncbi:MAG TPA: hypothetical protein VNE18_10365 [Rhodanobacter sp.]|nr:hypothetical protein [Rhodanobacter sp.]